MADAPKNTKLKNRTKSGKKANRQALRRRVFNLRRNSDMKGILKKIERTIAAKGDAEKLIPEAYQAIDKALKRGIIKMNTAARMKSGLVKRVRAMAA